jgi:hypothetical protein
MWTMRTVIFGPAVCLALAGCGTGTPIIAGAIDQVGIGISGGAQDQGGSLTVGYRGAKFAVVPVQNAAGEQLSLDAGSGGGERGFSVLAMLGLDAKGGLTTGAAVEQVLAVGPAADIWALGRARLTAEELARARAAGFIR